MKNALVVLYLVVGLIMPTILVPPIQSFQQPPPSPRSSLPSDLVLSTRGFFNNATGFMTEQGDRHTSAERIDFQLNEQNCPNDLAIYVHGVWAGEKEAKEQYDRVKGSYHLALKDFGQNIHPMPVILYTWDSNTIRDPLGNGWNTAKHIADENGRFLAKSILEIDEDCHSDTDIHIIAHSMGAGVVLSALHELGNNNLKIKSVHFMGAAVDDEKVSRNPLDADNPSRSDNGIVYGVDLEKHVMVFRNLFDPEDNYLQPDRFPCYYPCYERDFALGNEGVDSTITDLPTNYSQRNVQNELPEHHDINMTDADGDNKCDLKDRFQGFKWVPFWPFYIPVSGCGIDGVGDNHRGYMGFKDHASGRIVDDGVMDIVARDWSMS